jgi:hypothetical protein
MAKGGLGSIFDILFGDEITQLSAQLTRIEQKVDGLVRGTKETDMAEKEQLDALLARVRENGDVIGSVKVAFEGQAEQMRVLVEQLKTAVAEDNTDGIKAAAEALAAQTEELRASIPETIVAIQENT